MDRWIKHGGYYPIWLLRIWRFDKGHMEQRWMDEHIVVDGAVSHLDADIIGLDQLFGAEKQLSLG